MDIYSLLVESKYPIVVNSNKSRLEAHEGFFRYKGDFRSLRTVTF